MTLDEAMARLRARALRLVVLEALARGAILLIVLLTALAGIDVMLDVDVVGRLAVVSSALMGTPAWVILRSARCLTMVTDTNLATAVDRVTRSGGEVLTGTDLQTPLRHGASAELPGTLPRGLASLAIDRASTLCSSTEPGIVVPPTAARVAGRTLLMLSAVVALVATLRPDLARLELLRLFDPFGDHPAAGATRLDVSPGSTRVICGDTLDVTVRASGATPEEVELELATGDTEHESTRLHPYDEGLWRTQLVDVRQAFDYRVLAPRGSTRWFRVHVLQVPRLESIEFRVEPPTYTGRAPRGGPLPPEGIEGVIGTRFSIQGLSNRPLSGGEMVFGHHDGSVFSIELAPDGLDPRMVRGGFTLTGSGKITVSITDMVGVSSREVVTVPIRAVPDTAPRIELVEPRLRSFATPTARIPVIVQAGDDHGIARLDLFRSLNHSRPRALDIIAPDRYPRHLRREMVIELSDHDLHPGDIIQLEVRGTDARPPQPGTARSRVATIRVVTDLEMEGMSRAGPSILMLESRYRTIHRLMESANMAYRQALAAHREAVARQDPARQREALTMLDRATERLRLAQRALRELVRAPLHLDIERALRLRLLEMERELERLVRRSADLGGSGVPVLRDFEALQDGLTALAADYGRDIVRPIVRLAAVYVLLEDASRFSALYLLQRDLVLRLGEVRGGRRDPGSATTIVEITADQREVVVRLGALLEDIREHAGGLPDEAECGPLRTQAVEFVSRVVGEGIPELLTRAAVAMDRVELAVAHDAAWKAEERMGSLVKRVRAMTGPGGAAGLAISFTPMLVVGDTFRQLSRAAAASASRAGQGPVGLYGAPGESRLDVGGNGGAGSLSFPVGPDRTDATVVPLQELLDNHSGGDPGTGSISLRDLPPEYLGRVRAYIQSLAEDLASEEEP